MIRDLEVRRSVGGEEMQNSAKPAKCQKRLGNRPIRSKRELLTRAYLRGLAGPTARGVHSGIKTGAEKVRSVRWAEAPAV